MNAIYTQEENPHTFQPSFSVNTNIFWIGVLNFIKNIFFRFILFLCVWVFAHVYVCVPLVCLVPVEIWREALDPLEMGLQMVVSCRAVAENWTHIPWKSTRCSYPLVPSLYPLNFEFLGTVKNTWLHEITHFRAKHSTTWVYQQWFHIRVPLLTEEVSVFCAVGWTRGLLAAS